MTLSSANPPVAQKAAPPERLAGDGKSKDLRLALQDDLVLKQTHLRWFLEACKPSVDLTVYENPPPRLPLRVTRSTTPPSIYALQFERAVMRESIRLLRKEFDTIGTSDQVINQELVLRLARDYGIRGGRFIIYSTVENVDNYWANILNTLSKSNSDDIYTAMVSFQLRPGAKKPVHIIDIYIPDIFDVDLRQRFSKSLKDAGITKVVPLKPLIYDVLGISSRNPWALRTGMTHEEIPGYVPPPRAHFSSGAAFQAKMTTFTPPESPTEEQSRISWPQEQEMLMARITGLSLSNTPATDKPEGHEAGLSDGSKLKEIYANFLLRGFGGLTLGDPLVANDGAGQVIYEDLDEPEVMEVYERYLLWGSSLLD